MFIDKFEPSLSNINIDFGHELAKEKRYHNCNRAHLKVDYALFAISTKQFIFCLPPIENRGPFATHSCNFAASLYEINSVHLFQ